MGGSLKAAGFGDGSGREGLKINRYRALPDVLPISSTGIIPLIRRLNKFFAHGIIMNVMCRIDNSLDLCDVSIITTAFLPETVRSVAVDSWGVPLFFYLILRLIRRA